MARRLPPTLTSALVRPRAVSYTHLDVYKRQVQVREFCHELEGMGLQINDSKGSDTHILGLIGDTKAIAESWVPVSYTHL